METQDLTSYLNTFTTAFANTGADPWRLLASFYDTIEVRTTAAPPVKISVGDMGGAPSPYSQYLKPTIIFSGPAGQYTLAPYGVASPAAGWVTSLVSVGALVGLGVILGRLTKR